MNRHLVHAHRGETLWTSQPASLYTKNLKESLQGGLVSMGVGVGLNHTPLLTLYLQPHITQVKRKLYICLQQGLGQVGSGQDLKGLFECWKHILLPLRNMDLRKMYTMHTGHEGGVYVTVRQRAPATHSLAQSSTGCRVRSWLNP